MRRRPLKVWNLATTNETYNGSRLQVGSTTEMFTVGNNNNKTTFY